MVVRVNPAVYLLFLPPPPFDAAVLCDFGLARVMPLTGYDGDGESVKKTNAISTRPYRPPESLFDLKEYGATVDTYSTGVIFQQILNRGSLVMGCGQGGDIEMAMCVAACIGTPKGAGTDQICWPQYKEVRKLAVAVVNEHFFFLRAAPLALFVLTQAPVTNPAG